MFTRWAKWFDMPIGFLAAGVYFLVVVLSLSPSGQKGGQRHRALMLVHESLPWALVLAIAWFVCLQVFVIGTLCSYCMIVHGVGLLVAVLLWRRSRKEASQQNDVDGRNWVPRPLLSFGIFLTLLVGQIFSTPSDTHAITRYSYGEGKIRITSADAPHVALELFDYTCKTCRQLAPQLYRAIDRYQGQFSILAVPCPIERQCNPHLRPTAVEHADACDYARCAMALWVAAPDQFPEFHKWLLLTEPIPPLDLARERAIELAGAEAFQQALQHRRIDASIERGVELYRNLRRGAMPKLLVGDRMIQGAPNSAEKLYEGLEKIVPLLADLAPQQVNDGQKLSP
jgi:protein-disulfide isomerase